MKPDKRSHLRLVRPPLEEEFDPQRIRDECRAIVAETARVTAQYKWLDDWLDGNRQGGNPPLRLMKGYQNGTIQEHSRRRVRRSGYSSTCDI